MKLRLNNLILGLVLLCLLGLGCASNNVNPTTARPETGYVDFYAANDTELSWSIEQLKSNGSGKQVFYQFDSLEDKILRLSFKPGHYRLSITFINRPVPMPGTVEVEVKNGMVTPVCVTFVDAGTGQVFKKELAMRGTAYGRYGRGTRITSQETQLLSIQTKASDALPYKIKSQMPYAAEDITEKASDHEVNVQ